MSWEKMSWPSGVVPSRCAELTWDKGVKLMLLGSWGSITPAKIAMSTKNTRIPRPVTAFLLRRKALKTFLPCGCEGREHIDDVRYEVRQQVPPSLL